jgi:hemolysin activation/secretion protein
MRFQRSDIPIYRFAVYAMALVALSGLNDAVFAQAAVSSLGNRELQREQQQRLLDEQRQRIEQLRQLSGHPGAKQPAVPMPSEPARCISVFLIQVDGATLLPEEEQRRIVAPHEGQCLETQIRL